MELREHQKQAVASLANGKILYGGVGSGKSITALAYYMENERPRDIYVITTAKKRESLEWRAEAAKFGLGPTPDASVAGTISVDSWNNISRYGDVREAFFIFDEQRLVGNGAWVKSFLRIARGNRWILLSATPGDRWIDYAPVFIANGFYKNITDFKRQHVIYAPYVKYPVIQGYLGRDRLERLRNFVLVEMPYESHAERIMNKLDVGYDKELVKHVGKTRWHPFEDRPIVDAAEHWRVIRRIVNSDPSRIEAVEMLMKCHPRLIIFYNFNYELELLRAINRPANSRQPVQIFAEWNGHKHENVPVSDTWVYLVQYQSGAEGWNCTSTNAICFYSLPYSYKNWAQAQGRIDRMDTSYTKLYYYSLESTNFVDVAIRRNLTEKREFNERKAAKSAFSDEYLYSENQFAG